jgi:hypothetical protein
MLAAIETDFRTAVVSSASKDVPTLTRNEPMSTPGQAALPQRRTRTSAMPAAGQTAVA